MTAKYGYEEGAWNDPKVMALSDVDNPANMAAGIAHQVEQKHDSVGLQTNEEPSVAGSDNLEPEQPIKID